MDLSSSQNISFTSSTLSSSNRKRNLTYSSAADIPSKRSRFYGSYIRKQSFSLPSSIIYYITKNPSTAAVYQKLIQSCKYFFIKNPILVISSLNIAYDGQKYDISINDESVDFSHFNQHLCKIWITDELKIDGLRSGIEENFISPYISKIYKNDASKCFILWIRNILFKDFVFLTSKSEEIVLNEITVIDEDGSIIPLEKLFASLLNVKDFSFIRHPEISNIFTSKTAQELIKIPQFLALDKLSLTDIPENFDIESFYGYIKANNVTEIFLDFDFSISVAYKARLQSIFDEIVVNAERRVFKIPDFDFPGIHDSPSYNILNQN